MKKKNLIRFAQSLVILPVMTMSLSVPNIQNIVTSQNALAKQVNIASGVVAINQAVSSVADLPTDSPVDQKGQTLKAEALAIDAYFNEYDMPIKGMGMEMATAADKNDLDWRLLPAIAVRESTGGKNACSKVKNNFFGWGSCKVGFNSSDEAIETLAENLAGKNPNTAEHYGNKNVKEILNAYNPPSIVPKYASQVMAIMDSIGDADITPSTPTLATNLNT
jgi:flagellum-specific peptidoglycan hydrolase FlgJ